MTRYLVSAITIAAISVLPIAGCRGDGSAIDGDGGDADTLNSDPTTDSATDEQPRDSATDEQPRDSSDAPPRGSTDPEDCDNVIEVILRDFNREHPDFEAFSGNNPTTGLVEETLGSDSKPVFRSSEGNRDGDGTEIQITSKQSFDQWYRDVPGVNITFIETLTLEEGDDGVLTYDSGNFFPIPSDQGWGAEFENHPDKNFLFTTEIHMEFTYRPGQTFSFRGDDDLWIFIDNKLALDLGGLHPAREGTVDIEDFAGIHGLVENGRYQMDIFHAERHTDASNFRIDTNIECLAPIPVV